MLALREVEDEYKKRMEAFIHNSNFGKENLLTKISYIGYLHGMFRFHASSVTPKNDVVLLLDPYTLNIIAIFDSNRNIGISIGNINNK